MEGRGSIGIGSEEGSWVMDSAAIGGRRRHPASPEAWVSGTRGRLRQILEEKVQSRTPVKVVDVGEDVLVMDGVLVSHGANAAKPPPAPAAVAAAANNHDNPAQHHHHHHHHPNTNNNNKSSLSLSSSNKMDMMGGLFRYQFAHRKEELRWPPRSTKPTSEMVGGAAAADLAKSRGSGTTTTATTNTISSSNMVWPPTEAEDAYFTRVLYSSSASRLPVFLDISRTDLTD